MAAPSAIMSINNVCVSRIITFTNTTARADSGTQITGLSKTQFYVLEGSSFDFNPQDGSGILLGSNNQKYFYAFNAGTVGAGVYIGSNTAFRGSAYYLSLGSATVTSDVHYNCSFTSLVKYDVTLTSNLPVSVRSFLTQSGAGSYNPSSNVTLSTSDIPNYNFSGWEGLCPNPFFTPNTQGKRATYIYSISNLQYSCAVVAKYTPLIGALLLYILLISVLVMMVMVLLL